MTRTSFQMSFKPRFSHRLIHSAMIVGVLLFMREVCPAQIATASNETLRAREDKPQAKTDKVPLTTAESAEVLQVIRVLQERASQLEAAQANPVQRIPAPAPTAGHLEAKGGALNAPLY